MGTNYYLHEKMCDHCGQQPAPQHIGKSSGGWVFALANPNPGEDLPAAEWMESWENQILDCCDYPQYHVMDEYDRKIDPREMLKIITERPKDCLRSDVDGRHCLSHGEGSWDCIAGEFS